MRIGGFGAVVVALLMSCGGEGPEGPPPRTLTTPDVTGMLPGNATGTSFSGTYFVARGRIEACHCRSGTCSRFTPLIGASNMIVQEDGRLTISPDCVGGVNSDGTFWCGAQTGTSNVSLQLIVDQGTFIVSGGVTTGIEMTQELTVVLSPAQTDCDVRGHVTFALAPP